MSEKSKKFSFNNKKVLIICTLVLMVAAVAYVNYRVTAKLGSADAGTDAKPVSAEDTEQTVDVFAAYKDERTASRAKEMSYIDSVV